MRVKDESQWHQQLMDFANDPDPMAKKFEEFIVAWCEASESILDMWDEKSHDYGLKPSPIQALRDALPITEQSTKGGLTIGLLGMALLVVATHWEPAGDINDFYHSLTTIEQNLYMSVAATKLSYLELQAQEVGSGDRFSGGPDEAV